MNKYNIRETDNLNEVEYNGIEKIIHVIWKGDNPPECFNKEMLAWIGLSSYDWKIFGWRDSDLDWLKENADEYGKKVFEVAESMKEIAAYVDIIRLYIIYKYGGYYFDADFEVYRSISELSHVNADMIFCNTTDYYYPSISTGFFAAKKEHPFLKFCLDTLISNYGNGTMDEWIIARTGPIFIGNCYVNYNGEINPLMLQMYYFYASKIGDEYIDAGENGECVIKVLDKDYSDIAFAKHLFNSNGTYKIFD